MIFLVVVAVHIVPAVNKRDLDVGRAWCEDVVLRNPHGVDRVVDQHAFLVEQRLASDGKPQVLLAEVITVEVGEDLTEIALEKERGDARVGLLVPVVLRRVVGLEEIAGEAIVLIQRADTHEQPLGAG